MFECDEDKHDAPDTLKDSNVLFMAAGGKIENGLNRYSMKDSAK